MSSLPDAVLWLAIPAAAIWVITLADIASTSSLPVARRIAWAVMVTIVFPMALAWYLVRPTRGLEPTRLDEQSTREDPWMALPGLVVARRRGALDRATYQAKLSSLSMHDGTGGRPDAGAGTQR